MCGFAGFLTTESGASGSLEAVATGMALAIQHRGPDDAGVWSDAECGIALSHRRLSIIDLSPAGHQPMHSANGRYVLAFNGEIYNHLALRTELAAARQAPAWRGHSDTETLLAGFAAWGVTATLQRAVGMFAMALWDQAERRLTLARDRLGEKPLFYGWVHGAFVFGSELKALRAYPGFDNPVSRDALALYLQHCAVPAPYSIYQDIFKLEPGCVLALDAGGLGSKTLQLEPYWRFMDAVHQGQAAPFQVDAEAVVALETALREAVALQAVADVPLGAFLSGGVDSSAIVALMQAQSSRPVQTFTVGFDEAGFDESPHALAVARHLGTEHHALRVTAADARAVIPQLPAMYDEPFADSSQIPTHLVCQAARQQVTVALSGDAGDELFGGYNRYFWGPRVWNRMKRIPEGLRRGVAGGIARVPGPAWDALGRALPGAHGVARLGDKVHKLARLTSATSLDSLYRSLVTEWPQDAELVRGAARLPTRLDDASLAAGVPEAEQRMMLWDTLTYLPDDILTKVDRAAMSVSLETRVPFLDHRVVELAWRLPLHMKIRDGQGKWALRQVLYKYVPRELIERPKAGFGIPVGQWLRGPLREWAEGLLDEARLQREGYFNPAPIRRVWQEHLSGRHDWTVRLWTVLMFQAWLEGNP
ncbi:asparagine synthase (glutamine-hydrolyzing) [Polaromonas sp.]|uniref:asparagine synthase (glutamine-hydrolyzing) n=1 Tax=Polaromonas sp. TaxID=1869339 RepID=UPI00286B35C0|nr:asparagine synthase (glutamine-hydrolyzing) [Polaromonas sp.]